MILEKTIRKKKISPFYLEMVGGLIYYEFIGIAAIIVVALLSGFESVWAIFIFLMIVVAAIATYIDMRHIFLIALQLKTDKTEGRVITQDITILDYDFLYGMELNLGGYIHSFTHQFYTEPYIRIVTFNYLPTGQLTKPTSPLKFYMEEASITCWRQKNYKKYRAKYKQYEDEVNKRRVYEIPKKKRKEYEDTNHTILYMTYEKMQEFRRLFEQVNPREFRITKYETSWVFISIEPISGKEYPPEALECMEKINAMYP